MIVLEKNTIGKVGNGEQLRRISRLGIRLALLCAFALATASQAATIPAGLTHPVIIVEASRKVARSYEVVRIVRAGALSSGGGQPAYRPVDASLLQAVAYSKRGDVWIAPAHNGAQESGTAERIVVFDPSASRMSAFKIPREFTELANVAPAADGGIWSAYRHLAAIGHASADGSGELFAAPSDDDETLGLGVDQSGDAMVFEPLRGATGHVSTTGSWRVAPAHASTSPVADVTIDDAGDVAFTTEDGTQITRLSQDGSIKRIPMVELGPASALAFDHSGDIWFVAGVGMFGEIPSASEKAAIWRLPPGAYVSSLAPDGSGRVWLLGSRGLVSFDPQTSVGTVVDGGVAGSASDVVADASGALWFKDDDGITRFDTRTWAEIKYAVPRIMWVPLATGPGRICFGIDNDWEGYQAACLSPGSRIITVYADRFEPGIGSVVRAGDDMWLVEKGRAAAVDKTDSIRRFVYTNLPSGPTGAVALRDHTVWFAGAGLIERFSETGQSRTYRLTFPGNGPFGLAPDRDDGVLFTIGHGVGDISVDSGDVEHLRYYDTGKSSSPEDVVAGPDRAIWCTDTRGFLLRIAYDGSIKDYRVPTPHSEPYGIARGPDGAIWFTEFFGGKVGRLDPMTGAIKEFAIPYERSFPTGITSGKSDLWYLDLNNSLGRVTTTGKISEFPILSQSPVGY